MDVNAVENKEIITGCRFHYREDQCKGALITRRSLCGAWQIGCERGWLQSFKDDRDNLEKNWPVVVNH